MTATDIWPGRIIYLEATPWRVLRRLLASGPDPLPFRSVRPWQRREKDLALMVRLQELGLIDVVGEDEGEPTYRITERGKAAADLGEVHPGPAPVTSAKGSKSAKRK